MEGNTTGVLSTFGLSEFNPTQETEEEKASYEEAPASISCFSEVAVTQDDGDLARNSQLSMEGISAFGTSASVTQTSQDNLLSTHVAVLSVPDPSLFQMQPSSELTVTQQAVALTQEQVTSADTGAAVTVSEMIAEQSAIGNEAPEDGQQALATVQHIILDPSATSVEPGQGPTPEEPKKRKGGWPKGKKRKKEFVDVNKPRAPVTGYVRFLTKRRPEVKQANPHLQFHHITKLLGVEWSNLGAEEKQKYLDQAEEDKKRYVEELKAYQQSEQYQAFIKRQHNKRVKSFLESPEGESNLVLCQDVREVDDPNELYCRTCDQYFSSQHNKREHMYGRQHLQMLTGDFEREAEQLAHATAGATSATDTEHQSAAKMANGDDGAPTGLMASAQPLSVSQFTERFLEQNLDREIELRELRKAVATSQEDHLSLGKELETVKAALQKAENELGSVKAYGASLTGQLNNLRLVPTLFGIINL